MTRYIARRLLSLIPILFGVTLVVFGIVRAIPGDPARVMLGEKATPAQIDEFKVKHHLDRPWIVQYLYFVSDAAHLDLDQSFKSGNPVTGEIASRFPATMELALASMLLAIVVGLPLGVAAAAQRGKWVDGLCLVVTLLGISVPIFWLGLMLILLFSAYLGWLPFSGRLDVATDFQPITNLYVIDSLISGNWSLLKESLAHLVLPAVTLCTVPLAIIARMTRSCMLETLSADYVRTARAKGLTETQVLFRHALKNALIPVVTVMGLEFGTLLGGAVLTETVFAWPGLGRYTVDAIFSRDYPVIQGCVLVFALTFVLVNLAVDLLYGVLDPRIRYD